MDSRAAKLELARKKLREHQVQKQENSHKEITLSTTEHHQPLATSQHDTPEIIEFENVSPEDVQNSRQVHVVEEKFNNEAFSNTLSATEILISNERNLERQVYELQSKLSDLEDKHTEALKLYNVSNQSVNCLQTEIKTLQNNNSAMSNELLIKENKIKELENTKLVLSNENVNLQEQIEFTKTMLTAKESENNSLNSQLYNLQHQLDSAQLQLQQLTNGAPTSSTDRTDSTHVESNESLKHKILNLEQQLKSLQKEKENIHTHYQHYVIELNDHLKNVVSQNEDLSKEADRLSNRENSLVDQISDLEIRLQNYRMPVPAAEQSTSHINNSDDYKELQNKYEETNKKLIELNVKYEELERINNQHVSTIQELQKVKEESEEILEDISISKLNADMASDKVAAQKATEQNKKLKQDIQDLEDAFIKMSKDKLELTEKLSAEKFLNRELTIKLADAEEKAKDLFIKIKAKDNEMIRLQSNYRDIEIKLKCPQKTEEYDDEILNKSHENSECDLHSHNEMNCVTDKTETCSNVTDKTETCSNENDVYKHEHVINGNIQENSLIPKADAMKKLQERFLKIMNEVADLSDEKHRLEHIILQLQNETDTICEYVALYQQQRSLLKRRDEERSIQLKMFESECSKLKAQLEELTAILVRLSEDENISDCLQKQSMNTEIDRIMNLLSNLNNNSLIDPMKKSVDFKDFYPCSCCSGKLIEI